MHNDDDTPWDYVTTLLNGWMVHTQHEAELAAEQIEKVGHIAFGQYTLQQAQQLVATVLTATRDHGYPLRITFRQKPDSLQP